MSLNAISILTCLSAESVMSTISSANYKNGHSIRSYKKKLSSYSKFSYLLVISINFYQCLALIEGFLKSDIIGSTSFKLSISSFNSL